MVDSQLLTPQDIADQYQLKLPTIYVWLNTGKLKGVKLGDLWRVKQTDLDEFIKQNTEK